jgi:hypothetical protein
MNVDRVPVATLNAQGVTDAPRLTLASVRATLPGVAVAGLQEVANLTRTWSLRDRLARRLVGVAQDTSSEARAGVAVVWSKAQATRMGHHRMHKLCDGLPGAEGMRDRYAISVDLALEAGGGEFISAISAHRPPPRFQQRWPDFDAELREVIRTAPHPPVLFMDANASRATVPWYGLVNHQIGIDLVATHANLPTAGGAWLLAPTNSDHRAVALFLVV